MIGAAADATAPGANGRHRIWCRSSGGRSVGPVMKVLGYRPALDAARANAINQ